MWKVIGTFPSLLRIVDNEIVSLVTFLRNGIDWWKVLNAHILVAFWRFLKLIGTSVMKIGGHKQRTVSKTRLKDES